MISDLELLWQTYDFTLGKIAVLEDEFSHLLLKLNDFLSNNASQAFKALQDSLKESPLAHAINLPNDEDNISRDVLLAKFKSIATDLNLYYNKHIATIKELTEYYEQNKYSIPAEREVAVDSFDELNKVTIHLRDVLNASYKDVKNMLDEI